MLKSTADLVESTRLIWPPKFDRAWRRSERRQLLLTWLSW